MSATWRSETKEPQKSVSKIQFCETVCKPPLRQAPLPLQAPSIHTHGATEAAIDVASGLPGDTAGTGPGGVTPGTAGRSPASDTLPSPASDACIL